jgi:hypothetical protein
LTSVERLFPVNTLPSPTVWHDLDVTSVQLVFEKPRIYITRETWVTVFIEVKGIPSYWPIPRAGTAYFIDLSDPKYNEYDSQGKLRPVDKMIKNKVCFSLLLRHVSLLTATCRTTTHGVVAMVLVKGHQSLSSSEKIPRVVEFVVPAMEFMHARSSIPSSWMFSAMSSILNCFRASFKCRQLTE